MTIGNLIIKSKVRSLFGDRSLKVNSKSGVKLMQVQD